jgi:hypothetical protein
LTDILKNISIKSKLQIDGLIIVVSNFDEHPNACFTNLYIFDAVGGLIWRVPEDKDRYIFGEPDPFTAVRSDENGQIIVNTWAGLRYKLDVQGRRLILIKDGRRPW